MKLLISFNITLIAISLICIVVAHSHQLSGRVAISKFCFVNNDNYDNLKKKTIWENSKVPTAQAGTRKLINFTEYFYWILRISIIGGLIIGFPMFRELPVAKQLPIKMGILTSIMIALIFRDGFDVTKETA